jgi:hypothetical protein
MPVIKIEVDIHNIRPLGRADVSKVLNSIARQLREGEDLWGPEMARCNEGSFPDRRGGMVQWRQYTTPVVRREAKKKETAL